MLAFPSPLALPFRRRRRSAESTRPATPAAPDTPSTPSPADLATAYYTLLSWVSARATKFEIYLDTVNPPVARAVIGYYTSTSYVPTLLPSTTYYWKIVAVNDGGTATGPVWSFTTLSAASVIFLLAGDLVTWQARDKSLSITDALNAAPNTARMLFDTDPPSAGQAIRIGLGTLDDDDLLFGGEIQVVDQTYVGTPSFSIWHVNLIDHTFRLNKRRPFGTWVDVSATVVAQVIVAQYAPGFTADHVQADLATVSINFDGQADFMTCMGRLATAISGFTKVDYARDVWLALTDTEDPPDSVDLTHKPENNPSPMTYSVDHSQLRTVVYGKGHGEPVPTDVGAGETLLPLPDAVMFNPAGGQAIAATTSDGAQTEILTYESVQLGGGGSLVGPGAAPFVAPLGTLHDGTGIAVGSHDYAVTFVTGLGESLPGPRLTKVITGVVDPPSAAADNHAFVAGGSVPVGSYDWVYTFVTATGETTPSPISGSASSVGSNNTEILTGIQTGPGNVTARNVYRRTNGTGPFGIVTAIPNNTDTTFTDTFAVAHFGTPAPTSNTTVAFRIDLSSIPTGIAAVTSRKLYRTAAGASQLQLLSTLADNSTTIYADATADASLGANVPTSDTSGLTQPTGQVNAGSAALPTAGAGSFQANGGWATLSGDQIVRYTGISGNTLTGIPVSGPGAIMVTVLYGSQVLPAPALVGVNHWNGLARAMAKGSSVNIFVRRDDTAAQAALGQLELDDDGNTTDGIREYTITDERFGEDLLIATCDADLALFSRPIVSVDYYTRDPKSKSGKTVHIDLGGWGPPAGDYVIQEVEISFTGPARMPLYHVKASSVKFTLQDLLQRVVLHA